MHKLIIGTMSGTSMDSFDIVAAEFAANNTCRLQATGTFPLPAEYKEKYLAIINAGGASTLTEIGELNTWTGLVFAAAINQFIATNNLDRQNIVAIASPGQTIWHAPNSKLPFSWQLGDPNIIAEKTKITTIADFRNADIAAGGQGAPLAPLFHQAVFASTAESRCIVNIGGFSNVSILANNTYLGFDTGPGNCLLDQWTAMYFNQPYDLDGVIAKTGKVMPALLEILLRDPYFQQAAPKSTGREYFNFAWLEDKLANCSVLHYSAADVLLTLVYLTAHSITSAIQAYATPKSKVYLCGGGAYNPVLCTALADLLAEPVQTTAVLGIAPDWVEAALFAWLAKQRLANQPVDLTKITGSGHPVILGAVYQPNL